ncbi:DNA/RNA helicase domain-containing protein [Heliophilum fasciatum]|uniref:Uncharacterized protein DUF2075 n=1 Tax=Heliophilum fasciatum TaxID=35700 RepID=A0A4R2R6S0_9FIRM|nr:DNA/RNA helicase domain-containing protein [Heliophilum fasciatum]MCW2279528.1 hypothetical protein [Heliophilum fasciatum]TCP57559.1 uncharacterized protein DUF2075 [Heliophilum fasciatum]
MARSYYSASLREFLMQSEDQILGELARNNEFSLDDTQKWAWMNQIKILKKQLNGFDGKIIFEYTIPRVGKRIDNVFIHKGIVYLLEFKVGENAYNNYAIDQVMDYALDLKNFHKESHNRTIVPILVATEAQNVKNNIVQYPDGVYKPLLCNQSNISTAINQICNQSSVEIFSVTEWENSIYKPTPTIIEAAQALYQGHSVNDISRSDSGAINLNVTTQAINDIIDRAKRLGEKSICFITGVPGAGKTLAGLNIANERHRCEEDEHAVFLSGNGPLVDVLQEALADNQCKDSKGAIKKSEARTKTKAFIQIIHHFRDDALVTDNPPIEKVAIFDEAQRAWTLEKTSEFMQKKKGRPNFQMSEPEFLISVMDRHKDWAVIV